MKIIITTVLLLLSLSSSASFSEWFYPKSLRVDYIHTGDAQHETFSIDELISEPHWGGSLNNLIDTLKMGEYYFKVFDQKSQQLIYSRGYSTLFAEWQFTDEAKSLRRSFTETLLMPFPKKDVHIVIESRDKKGVYQKAFEFDIDVDSYFIKPEQRLKYPVYPTFISGDAANKVDIVIIPEGYTESEMDQFKKDCDQFTAELFSFSPFSERKEMFSIRGILAPSSESGTDIPADGTWKKTLLNSSFYTFNSERYLMTYDNKSVRDVAANAPYDQIYILVNSKKYGGGAIYNYYSTSVNSNSSSAKIFVHEFGHGFAGLGDEYDDGSTSFNDMYPTDIEPWEPNITTLVDFDHKWKKLLPALTPVPTQVNNENPLQIGVYEGAGYVTKKLYRPATDCLMRSFKGDKFCKVCEEAILHAIDFYTY